MPDVKTANSCCCAALFNRRLKMTLTKDQHRETMYGLCIARITDAAEGRMKLRTAKDQHAAVLAELQRERDEVVPDANQDSDLRNNVLR